MTATGPAALVIWIVALPLRDGSARLVAVRTTGSVAGTDCGATKSTLPDAGPVGATHGFDPVRQTCPTVVLPFVTPFMVQVTAVSVVFITVGVNVMRWLVASVAAAGATLTLTLLVTVTVDAAVTSAGAVA